MVHLAVFDNPTAVAVLHSWCLVMEYSFLELLQGLCKGLHYGNSITYKETVAQRKARLSEPGPTDQQKIKNQGCPLHLPNLSFLYLKEKVPPGKDSVSTRHFSKTFWELRLEYPVWHVKCDFN